ncbi:acyloxyacyl hydrolase [Bacteroides helcogenes]|uniref:Lipid A 3-O-deacylase-related protein n=1 Tax=Bacteroides helcogenes (strain ATCC 35417 / DSM 20613 / JCM 6297 / CCUG 15421 / P 36-108) TaxID=693979 RepID=E6SUB2_BACT6|nr:acyloxyacyl hydrolase [Bacteroides helcogenes]ADV42330.1 hypothetical protein Bache_0300 [Bacteroides helcogenes P 36-108]MDY5237214.1 acyloxyacyl hydrolase [Bacteroides helcogenes]
MENKIQTWKMATLFVMILFLPDITYAQKLRSDSYPERATDTASFVRHFIHRLEIEGRAGYIFPTNPFLKGQNLQMKELKNVYTGHLKYSFKLRPHTAASHTYIDAYQGIGLGYFNFGNRQELGSPVALYLFQGGNIAKFSPRLSLNYEWNFGISAGWKPYDEYTNPENKVVGSNVNAYLNANIYLNWVLSPKFDLMIGATGSHFSNGNTQYPNSGLNTVDCKIGLAYNFNRIKEELGKNRKYLTAPHFPRHISYDLTLFGSWRKKAVNVPGGQVPAPGTYPVFGFNLAPMYNLGYKFRAGVALDGVYDSSANINAESNTDQFHTPPAGRQLALGLSARGEFVMPYFTIGIGFGANVLHGGGDMKSFYQILALKIDVSRNSFLHIGYNLRDLHEPNYLMLGIGYRFNNRRPIFH